MKKVTLLICLVVTLVSCERSDLGNSDIAETGVVVELGAFSAKIQGVCRQKPEKALSVIYTDLMHDKLGIKNAKLVSPTVPVGMSFNARLEAAYTHPEKDPKKFRVVIGGEMVSKIANLPDGFDSKEKFKLFFDDITTGASGDIKAATRIAKDMVTTYGMSDLGPIQYDSGNGSVFLGRDYASPSNASSQIAYEIDIEVRKIIDKCHADAKKILTAHKKDLIAIAEALIVNETLTAEEIDEIVKGTLVVEGDKLVKKEKSVKTTKKVTSKSTKKATKKTTKKTAK